MTKILYKSHISLPVLLVAFPLVIFYINFSLLHLPGPNTFSCPTIILEYSLLWQWVTMSLMFRTVLNGNNLCMNLLKSAWVVSPETCPLLRFRQYRTTWSSMLHFRKSGSIPSLSGWLNLIKPIIEIPSPTHPDQLLTGQWDVKGNLVLQSVVKDIAGKHFLTGNMQVLFFFSASEFKCTKMWW